jgi:Coenzyme PQQ synthesis protein D (PqqD)
VNVLNDSASILICEDVYASKNENDNLVLFNLNTSMYFGLDSIGAIYWEHINRDKVVPEIRKKLSGLFNVDEQIIHKDLEGLVIKLIEKELVYVDY